MVKKASCGVDTAHVKEAIYLHPHGKKCIREPCRLGLRSIAGACSLLLRCLLKRAADLGGLF